MILELSNNVKIRKARLTDEQIIEELKQGRTDSFKELILRYEPRIASTVIGMLGQCAEAEDVGQETFVRFYRNIHNFRKEAGVGTYLTRIAINLSINELRRRKRKSALFVRNNDVVLQKPDANEPLNFDRDEWVQRAIDRLEPKFKAVVVLRLIDGFSTEETAKILGIPLGTVLSRLSRAQQKLQKILKPLIKDGV